MCWRPRTTRNPYRKGRLASHDYLPFVSSKDNTCTTCRNLCSLKQLSTAERNTEKEKLDKTPPLRAAWRSEAEEYEESVNATENGKLPNADVAKFKKAVHSTGSRMAGADSLGIFWPLWLAKDWVVIVSFEYNF